jgi:hypothetical protein
MEQKVGVTKKRAMWKIFLKITRRRGLKRRTAVAIQAVIEKENCGQAVIGKLDEQTPARRPGPLNQGEQGEQGETLELSISSK